jgi:uncharacterized protein YbcI
MAPDDAPDTAELPGRSPRSVGSAISNLVMRVTREYTGRGPMQARTYVQDDLVTVVLRETLTKGEQRLVDGGQADHIRATRHLFQQAMREEMVAGVEDLTGHRVVAFMSDNHFYPDLAFEVFVLEPRADGIEPGTGSSDPV